VYLLEKSDLYIKFYSVENGIVENVMLTSNTKGNKLTKVKVRLLRAPELGDKFASRHGQKGTCGLLVTEDKMPFNNKGIIPDVVINPQAIPSRMTIGHLLECLLSKVVIITGEEGNSTAFNIRKFAKIFEKLRKFRFNRNGLEIMINGVTGVSFRTQVFVGPTYYQRLSHMVTDKINCRAQGQIVSLTRQPLKGKIRGGGQRLGEMERDCLISYGAATLMRERLILSSDIYRVHVCCYCGLFAIADITNRRYFCRACIINSLVKSLNENKTPINFRNIC